MGGVLKIAKSGGNALTDADKDLVFTSERSCLVEILSGYIDLTTDGDGDGTAEFTHSLGYRPAYYCFVRNPLDTTEWYPNGDGFMGAITSVGTTKLYISITGKEENATYRIYYSIFGNQQEDGTGAGNSNVSGNLKIAKDGYDAVTETDARNMKFFSGKNVFKIDDTLSGTKTISFTAPDVIIEEITHNLGYVPIVFVLWENSGEMLPNQSASYYMDSTKLYLYYQDLYGSSTYNITFKYKIMRDKIA